MKKVFTMLRKQTYNNAVFFYSRKSQQKRCSKIMEKQWNGRIFYSHRTTSSRGIFIALIKNFEFKLLSLEICDPPGRYIILNIEMMGFPFTLISYYAPNNQSGQLKNSERNTSKTEKHSNY